MIQLNVGADGWDLDPDGGDTGGHVREAEPSCSAQINSRSQSWLASTPMRGCSDGTPGLLV